MWEACKAHFKCCYISRKRYHDAKGTKVEEMNKIDSDPNTGKPWRNKTQKKRKQPKNNYNNSQHTT